MPSFTENEIAVIKRFLDHHSIAWERCAWTGQIILTDTDEYVCLANGDFVTEEAFDEDGGHCHYCNDALHLDDLYNVQGPGGETYNACHPCRSSYTNWCDRCDDYFDEDIDCYCEEDDYESSSNSSGLRSYAASPLGTLEGFRRAPGERALLDHKTLWLGVELEVVSKDGSFRSGYDPTLEAVKDFAILKYDGSLPPHGFEICTVPGTLAWHKQAWEGFFQKAAPHLLSYDAPGRCCGMHIHISKDAVTALQAGKMQVFVAEPANAEFLKAIAGRWGNNYAQTRYKTIKDGKKDRYHDHFDALGYSSRTGRTLEFRIFRGTVNPNGFFKNLEFTVALVEFCKEVSINGLTVGSFLSWFANSENRTQFPVLDDFLHRKGYLQIKKPQKVAQAA